MRARALRIDYRPPRETFIEGIELFTFEAAMIDTESALALHEVKWTTPGAASWRARAWPAWHSLWCYQRLRELLARMRIAGDPERVRLPLLRSEVHWRQRFEFAGREWRRDRLRGEVSRTED